MKTEQLLYTISEFGTAFYHTTVAILAFFFFYFDYFCNRKKS